MKKKLLASLLALCLVFSLLPASVLADGDNAGTETGVTAPVTGGGEETGGGQTGGDDGQEPGDGEEPGDGDGGDEGEDGGEPEEPAEPEKPDFSTATVLEVTKSANITSEKISDKTGEAIKYSVNVDLKEELKWFKADTQIGRNKDGWWIGIRAVAPEFVKDDASLKKVIYRNNECKNDSEKNFFNIKDGKVSSKTDYDAETESAYADRYFLYFWGGITNDVLKNTAALGQTEWKYTLYFNWDGSEETGVTVDKSEFNPDDAVDMKGVDEIITLTFDLAQIKELKNNDGTTAWKYEKKVTVTAGDDGKAIVGGDILSGAIAAANKESGNKATIAVTPKEGSKDVEVEIGAAGFAAAAGAISEGTEKSLKLDIDAGAAGKVTLDAKALTAISKGATGDTDKVAVSIKDATPVAADGETPAEKKIVKVEIKKDTDNLLPPDKAGQNGTITITIPVEEGVTAIWYGAFGSDGNTFTPLEKMDATFSGKTATFKTNHLSAYAQYTNDKDVTVKDFVVTKADGTFVGGYDTLKEAVTEAAKETGSLIKMNADVTLEETLTISSGDFTLDGNGHTISAGKITGEANKNITMIKMTGNTKLTLKNVTLNGKNNARLIMLSSGKPVLTVEDGTTITKGNPQYDYIGGVYVTGNGKLVMNGGKITGNSNAKADYKNDGYLQYCADVWVGNDATATINGGTVGNILVNATNTNNAKPKGGELTVTTGAKITNVFAEADADKSGKVVSADDGTIKTLYIALDDATKKDESNNDADNVERAVVEIKPTGKVEMSAAYTVPAGQTATVVSQTTNAAENGVTTVTLSKDITIGEGANLVIPEDYVVSVQEKTQGTYAGITNNGTLTIEGKLYAAEEGDNSDPEKGTNYVSVTGGTIAVGKNGYADVDKSSIKEVTVKLDLNGGTGVEKEYKVILNKSASDSGGETTTATMDYTLPIPTRSGCTFKGWKSNSEGATMDDDGLVATLTIPGDGEDNVTYNFTAQWKAKPGSGSTEPLNPGEPTTPDEPDKTSFNDVPDDAYYAEAVAWAVEKGITNGTGENTFSPNASCTRAQMVTFLWRLAGSPKAEGTCPFSDVAEGSYYYDAVIWAVEKGITNGTGDGLFSPADTVTRAQSVTFLYRYAGTPAAEGASFGDVASNAYYADAVAWAAANGVTNGTSADTFSPNNDCTRAQIVTFMYRYAA